MLKKLNITVLIIILTFLVLSTNRTISAQNCTTMGDVNNDGLSLSPADLILLQKFLEEDFGPLAVPYSADMNGDCVIDWNDLFLYSSYFIFGQSVFTTGLPIPTCCTVQEYCCTGIRGNVDYDSNDLVDISDLNYMVDFMFTDGPRPICPMEANMDGSGVIDITDLYYLVDFMFTDGPAPVSCL